MSNNKIRANLTKYVRDENCMISAMLTATMVADKVGCTKEELDAFLREEYEQPFSIWKQDPGITLGYPECVSCGKHRRGRPYGRKAELYQCLICGNITEKKKIKYNTNGTVSVSEHTTISLPTLGGRGR